MLGIQIHDLDAQIRFGSECAHAKSNLILLKSMANWARISQNSRGRNIEILDSKGEVCRADSKGELCRITVFVMVLQQSPSDKVHL